MKAILPKPLEVRKALFILYSMIALGILRVAFTYDQVLAQLTDKIPQNIPGISPTLFLILTSATSFGFNLVNIYLIGRGLNWARHLLVFLFLLGVPMSIKPLIEALQNTPLSGVIGTIQVLADIYGIYLLYHPASTAWFKKTEIPPPPTAT